jgi:starch synthase
MPSPYALPELALPPVDFRKAARPAPKTGAVAPFPRRRPRVLFVTPESGDFLQAGGLGSVAASLPRALRRDCDVRVLAPGFPAALALGQASQSALEIVAHLPGAGDIPPCSIGRLTAADGLVLHLVLCAELYERPGSPYADAEGREHSDNDIRFARLSLAAAELAEFGVGGWRPDVTHLNDWPAALAAGYLKWRGANARTVLTLHNLAHQGVFDADRRAALAIPESAFTVDGVEFYERLSFLKAGLNYADEITTVSETYAEEITRAEFGCGLEGLIAKRRGEGRLTGILNGIDASWDPRADRICPYLLDPQRWKSRYADYIRGAFGLSLSRAPLFVFVARLTHQKGTDLVIDVAERIVERGAQLVMIGRGDPETEAAVAQLATRFPEAIGARIGFKAAEARAAFAAADFLLMPSRYEPCGLSQMFAQRFGALPIAHRTGGLAETIEDGVTGLLFDGADVASLRAALERALELYGVPRDFYAMRRAAMAKRFDWDESAAKYTALYRRLAASV